MHGGDSVIPRQNRRARAEPRRNLAREREVSPIRSPGPSLRHAPFSRTDLARMNQNPYHICSLGSGDPADRPIISIVRTHRLYLAVRRDLLERARTATQAAMAEDLVARPSRAPDSVTTIDKGDA